MHSPKNRLNQHLLIALALAFVFHGGLLLSGTFQRTYDAYIHVFFADHYARNWFDHWDYRWYTGFTMTSYPPGSQQSIALLSNFIGLLNGFIVVQLFAILLVIIGVYRSSKVWVGEEAAGYAALIAVFASSITETVHVFGQLPTMFSLGFILNSLPFVRLWLDGGKIRYLFSAWIVIAGCTAAHHVTTLFGSIFFIGPVIASAMVEKFREPLPDEPPQHPGRVGRKNLRPLIMRRLRRIIPVTVRSGVFGVGLVTVLLIVVLPYWLWSKDDPINQISIPHASRDSFIQNSAAGLVFWVIPYGLTLLILPYIFYKGFSTRAWPLAMSISLAFFLGTGGTTPFPKMLLGGAYEILTLDRFTFWATILMLPLVGEFVQSIRHRGLAKYFREQFGQFTLRGIQIVLLGLYLFLAVVIANFTQFRKFQPAPIDMQPIVNFLEKDQHSRWRYMPLGFGDQMAWLSAQTTATTVDGNYHSARRLPELTTTPIERLEGAKFRGIPGIGSLQQFLAVPEKYNLKFIFSNDQFYDPLLYFSGWHKLQRLENGIMVWEREDIPPLPEVLPRKEIPMYQRLMWGIVPMSAIFSALLRLSAGFWWPTVVRLLSFLGIGLIARLLKRLPLPRIRPRARKIWLWLDKRLLRWSYLPESDEEAVHRWQLWKDWLDKVRSLKPAPPSAQHLRSALLLIVLLGGISGVAYNFLKQSNDPSLLVQSYYDDLDFRRFDQAYAKLDPLVRPNYEQYRLQLSVTNGLVASYGKLDSVRTQVLSSEPDRVEIQASTLWITSLSEYPTVQKHVLVKRNNKWYITPDKIDLNIPPDQFFAQDKVSWYSQGRRRVTTETTSFNDVLDRPQLQILSSRLVENNGRYSVVGELINLDVNPADSTVTAFLYDADNNVLSSYNAQSIMVHKLLPKEVTPFRVDFEGVAGTVLNDDPKFKPGSYTPLTLKEAPVRFEVYAKAVVTGRDLSRDVGAQDLNFEFGADGKSQLKGQLINSGTVEATIPHVLVTYYDDQNRVMWVDQFFIESGIRPQRALTFSVPLIAIDKIKTLLDKGDLFANILQNEVNKSDSWLERIPVPAGLGYSSLRVSVNYFSGGDQ